jgi:hypothetical protein
VSGCFHYSHFDGTHWVRHYRLEACHGAHPGFTVASVLTLADGLRASRHALWDEERGRMVTFAEVIRSNARPARDNGDPYPWGQGCRRPSRGLESLVGLRIQDYWLHPSNAIRLSIHDFNPELMKASQRRADIDRATVAMSAAVCAQSLRSFAERRRRHAACHEYWLPVLIASSHGSGSR